jgi:hypothetical protein
MPLGKVADIASAKMFLMQFIMKQMHQKIRLEARVPNFPIQRIQERRLMLRKGFFYQVAQCVIEILWRFKRRNKLNFNEQATNAFLLEACKGI